jgi:transposase
MRFKSKRMNAKLYASNLAHIPEHIQWVACKLGLPVVSVNPAYSSQECNRCHFVHRDNRPDQQTFCCQVCGFAANADEAAALNLVNRLHDVELTACTDLASIKALLHTRHRQWCAVNGHP